MVTSAVVNAVGEELFLRDMFAAAFPASGFGACGGRSPSFSLWHLAPQVILPSRHGRWGFTAGCFPGRIATGRGGVPYWCGAHGAARANRR